MSTIKYNSSGIFKILLLTMTILFVSSSHAQTQNVLKGKIVDREGNPIQGAVINIDEENRIILSDKDGYFSISGVKPTDELCVNYTGHQQQLLPIDLSEEMQIIMHPIDEYMKTVPVPFSRTEQKFVTNSTSSVSGEELAKYPITVLQNAFTSTVTGIQTYEAQSEPGWSETAMYIRGIRTMNSFARSPLIIVDNMERDLSFLDAFPIESITVLKDAAASSIYGMRGANGVIMVTTKRGESGRTKINFTQEVGFQTASGIPETQNAYNYVLTKNQAALLDGSTPPYSESDVLFYKEAVNGTLDPALKWKYANTNWHDEMLRDLAPQYRTNLTISGGNQRTKYFVSFSYLRQEGLYDTKWTELNDNYSTQHSLDRYNLRSNIDLDVNDYLNVSLDLGGRIDNIKQPGIDVWNIFTWGAGENLPIYPVFTPDGNWFMPNDNDSKNGAAQIAGRGFETNRRRNLYTNITATGNLDPLLKGLKAKVTVGFDSYETFQSVQRADYDAFYYNFQADVSDPSEYTYTRKRTAASLPNPTTTPRDFWYNINMIGGLDYTKTIDKHAINAQTFVRTYQNVVRGQHSSNRNLSYNLTGNYVYDNRYVFSGNLSYMGNDNFHPDDRFGLFYGISGGWVISEESWLKESVVDLLKFRASYGKAGQSVIGSTTPGSSDAIRYPYQSTHAIGNGYNFGSSQTAYPGTYEASTGSRNISWEVSEMANLGIDFDINRKKLFGSFDMFKEWRSRILISRNNIPSSVFGAAIPQDSYGKAETRGFELTLGHANRVGEFNYAIEGMLTWNTNKITEMDEIAPDYAYQASTGERIDQRQLLIFKQWASHEDRIPTSHEDAINHPEKYPWHAAGKYKLGNAIFEDVNGDRIINTYDQIPSGYGNIPELIPSITLNAGWKGFDLRFVMTAYLNRTVETRENMDYGFGWGGTSTHAVTDTWGYYSNDPTDPRNINAKYPRLSNSFSNIDRNFPYNQSTIWVVNGDFLSLRNIEFGYSLPEVLISKINLTKCRFYFSGYNLHTWSHLPDGFDPENPTNYIWAYPKTKSFSVGINVGF